MIPMSKDVENLIGPWAEGVENRGLLHEKFALPKVWSFDEGGKLDEAARWNVLRIVARGKDILSEDSKRLFRESTGKNVSPENANRKEKEASVATSMAKIGLKDSEISKTCVEKGRRLLKDLAESFDGSVVAFEATLGSRMMINLAGGVVENVGIALDRCFGLPVIPGSAVKGITRAQALWEIKEADEDEKIRLLRLAMILFGFGKNDLKPNGGFGWAAGENHSQNIARELKAEDFKGCACFLPAYPTTLPKLVVDMVNPHYSKYYSGKSTKAEDNDNPKPNYFPAVETGSSFAFAALVNRMPELPLANKAEILDQLKKWLERAVTHKGVGAKTAAGYGWFELGRREKPIDPNSLENGANTEMPPAPASPLDQLVSRFKNLNTKDNFPAALPQMVALVSEADLRSAFDRLVPESERRKLRKNNPYWQSFTSGKAGPDGQKILTRLGIKLI